MLYEVITVQGFQERLRADLANQQILSAMSEAAFVPESVATRFLEAQLEERTVHMVQFQAKDFTAGVNVDEAAAKAYYDQNAGRFSVPARLKAQYVMLTPAALKSQVQVAEDRNNFV